MTTRTEDRFAVEVSPTAPDYNKPQKMGRRLWAPMLAMSLMAWPAAVILALWRASVIAGPSPDPVLIARLGQLVPAVMFIGFLSVFTAISFAIARILGVFRKGGGAVQEAARRQVHTLRMPGSAKGFMALMMMATMVIAVAVVLHFVVAAALADWAPETIEQWSIVLEAARRLGIAMYLVAITLGLGSIINVLRFQSQRIRELGSETAQT